MPAEIKDPVVPAPEAILHPCPHTNCCGATILAPCTKSGVLIIDYNRPVPDRTDYWGHCKYKFPYKTLTFVYKPATRREDVELAFKNSLPKLRASAFVQFLFVPEWFREEFETMIKRRKWFHKAGQSPAGVLYIFCEPAKEVPE